MDQNEFVSSFELQKLFSVQLQILRGVTHLKLTMGHSHMFKSVSSSEVQDLL